MGRQGGVALKLSRSTTVSGSCRPYRKNLKATMNKGLSILTTLTTIYLLFENKTILFTIFVPPCGFPTVYSKQIFNFNMVNMDNMTKAVMTGVSAVHIDLS
jgi:hypothetical protein